MNTSRSLYRVLLRLCPPDLRAEFGAEMEELFVAELRRARGLGTIRVWTRAIADVLRHGTGARNDAWSAFRTTSSYVEYDTGRFWMDTWRYDLRHAARVMLRQRGTTAIILLTLGLAIGANTAVFSAVHAVLLKPLPYADAERLAMIYEKRPAEGNFTNSVSPADYLDWARLNQSFTAIAAFGDQVADLTGAGDPERIAIGGVTARYFDVLGIRPLHGRLFRDGDDVTGQHQVAVIAHSLWQQRFGGDPSIVGRTIELNGVPQRVIGVLQPETRAAPVVSLAVGEPLIFTPLVLRGPTEPPRAAHYLTVYGRLKPAVSMEQARDELDRIGRDLEAQYPQWSRGHGAHVTPLAAEVVKSVRSMLLVLLAAVGFVLLIACINVTNLLLARAAGRRREMAVRSAIGANRARLVRQVLAEAAVLAVTGGALGTIVALWGVQLLSSQIPSVVRPDTNIVFSVPVLMFTAIACVVTGLIAGALPAWHMVREDPAAQLKEGGRSPVSLRRRLRFALIIAEVALTSLLLVGAGLTLRSFQRVLMEPAGIETAGRLTFSVALPRARYADGAAANRFFGELESRLAGEPSVRSVGGTSALPLSGADGRRGIVIEGVERTAEDGPTRAHPRSVTANYLTAAGARLREGRAFSGSDRAGAPLVAIINDTMARRYWRDRSPIGDRVRFTDQQEWREVVGIVADVRHWGLDTPANPEMYLPYEQYQTGMMWYVLEAAAEPLSLIPNVQRHVRELDSNLPLSNVRTFDEVAARSVEQRRFTMLLLACFAVLALVLAAAGIYGVMAHLVSLRTPELGVRLTLGASPASVMRGILGEGATQALVGLAIGLGASLALMQGLRTILFGVEPTDPLTLVAVGASLLLVALIAVAVPALRAMRIDPVTALRSQ
jgi:putative ABC transport system permease protein